METRRTLKRQGVGMGAPKNNKFWLLRTKHGRDKLFPDPDVLWSACCEYFDWVEANPLYEDRVITFQGKVTHEPAARMRAMTMAGLCLFLDIDPTTWKEYGKRKDYNHVVTRAERVIYSQKFAGAAADLLNANIIARDLGLRDKQETEHTGQITINSMMPEPAPLPKDLERDAS